MIINDHHGHSLTRWTHSELFSSVSLGCEWMREKLLKFIWLTSQEANSVICVRIQKKVSLADSFGVVDLEERFFSLSPFPLEALFSTLFAFALALVIFSGLSAFIVRRTSSRSRHGWSWMNPLLKIDWTEAAACLKKVQKVIWSR